MSACLHGTIGYCQECARSTVPIGHSAPVPPPTVQPGTILFAAPSPSIRDLLTCPFCGVVPLSCYSPLMSTAACNNDACPANPSIDVREGDQPEGSTTAAECRRLWNHRPTTTNLLVDAARILTTVLHTEYDGPDGTEDQVIDRIAFTLGVTRDRLEEATGPWHYEDEDCPTCGGASDTVPPVCPDCDGTGRQTIKRRPLEDA